MRLDLSRFRRMDWPLNVAVFVLLAFGLSAIYSVALSRPESDFLNVKKQLFSAFLGLVAFAVAARGNYRLLRNWALVLYLLGGAALLGVLLLGADVRGTTGWFDLWLFRFQPVEAVKVALAVALAAYFAARSPGRLSARHVAQSALIVLVPALLVMRQPDLGSALLLVSQWGIVALMAGMRARHLLVLSLAGAALSLLAWNAMLAPYQKARVLSFIDPASDPLGQGYNVSQAVIAIGSGGVFGRGLGFGSQSQLKFLPESQTDFVFAVIAEELGLVGACVVLGSFAFMLWRVVRIARAGSDDFTGYLLVGFAGILLVQGVVNVGANLALLPVTGVTLPLVSYGGSSLISTMLMLGIAQSAAIRSRGTDGDFPSRPRVLS